MKKIFLTITFLLSYNTAWATVHYFDNGSPDNTLPCTIGDPCDNFPGTTLDNAGALAAGDSVLFKAGDTWTTSEAEVAIRSNGTAGNRITIGRYGTGANPKFVGASSTTYTWTSAGGGVYYTSDISNAIWHNMGFWDVDADKGLMHTYANNNALEAGSWCAAASSTPGSACTSFASGTFKFIRRWDGSDPTGHPFRVATSSYAHNSFNGDRGLVRTTTDSAYGDYVDFVDIDIEMPAGIGWSTSGYNTRSGFLNINGSPRDGMLGYCATGTSEAGSYWEDYYSTTRYSSAFGVGEGQGVTTYCDNTSWIGSVSNYNAMFGFDFLDFSATTTNVTQGLAMRVTATNNGLSPQTNGYDSNLYIDGGSEIMVYGARTGISGTGSAGAGNARAGSIVINSEIDSNNNPPENIDILNSYGFGVHYGAFSVGTVSASTAKNIRLRWNTFSAYNAGAFELLTQYGQLDTTADNFGQYYNIWLGDNSAVPMPLGSSASLYDFDFNGYYRRGGSTTFFNNGSNRTLAQWQADSGEDANSAYGDPLFVTDSDTAPDLHLQAGSPYLDFVGTPSTFSYQSWVPQTVKDDIGVYGVKGSTIAAGTYDDVSVDADLGFHFDYPSLTSYDVTPQSLTSGDSGNVDVSFTMPQYVTALKYNWKIKVVFPAGFTLNNGGSTAVSNISGFNGGATASVSGQTVTVTRDGDGYSTFPGNIAFTLSNIKNPTSAGAGGVYNIYTTDENDNQIATSDNLVPSDTFISPAPTEHFSGGYFKCTWVQVT